MISAQMITLAVLAAVVIALIWDRVRADVVALAGAAVLLMTGVVRPVEVQSAFASPAIVEQMDSTILIRPGMSAVVDAFGNLVIDTACGLAAG